MAAIRYTPEADNIIKLLKEKKRLNEANWNRIAKKRQENKQSNKEKEANSGPEIGLKTKRRKK